MNEGQISDATENLRDVLRGGGETSLDMTRAPSPLVQCDVAEEREALPRMGKGEGVNWLGNWGGRRDEGGEGKGAKPDTREKTSLLASESEREAEVVEGEREKTGLS